LIEDHDDPLFFLWSEADQCLLGGGQVVNDPHDAGDMAAAFETKPLLMRRPNFPSKSGGVPEHGNVDARQLRNSESQTGHDSPFEVVALGHIAHCELIRGRHEFWIV
jgi:hypothetical protein